MKYKNVVQTDSPGRRAAAYWYIDGLPEIAFGLVLLVYGIYALVCIGLQRLDLWIGVGAMIAASLYFVILIMHRRILDSLKAHITYPRTGYARPPKDIPKIININPTDEILTIGRAHLVDENVTWFRNHTFVIFFIASFLMKFLPGSLSLPLVMTATAAFIYFLNRDDVRPYSWRAVLPIALAGCIAAGLGLTARSQVFVPIVIGGAWMLGIGIWTLIRYLRANPKPDPGQEGLL